MGRGMRCSFLMMTIAMASPSPAVSAPAEKPIKVVVASVPNGSLDLYARLIATHLTKHLPGNPVSSVQYMPGAGGLVGTLYMYEKAMQDGTELAMLPRDIPINQILRPEAAGLDARRFTWIGRLSSYEGIMYVASRTGIRTADDLRRIPVIAGSWGQTNETYTTPTLLNVLAETKFKIVIGYRGGPDVDLAIEQGEIDGRMASWTSLKAQRPQWLRDGFVVIPFQSGLKPHPELPNVPLITELARTEEGRRILEFQNSPAEIGWSIVAPPNVPSSRVAMLRDAFDKAVSDPELRAEAGKRGLDINPSTGKELEEIVNRTVAMPADALATLKRILETNR